MSDDDRQYLMHRAEAEITRAERATQQCAAKAHYQLAEAYLAKIRPTDLDRTGLAR